jgi:hypothetical protein
MNAPKAKGRAAAVEKGLARLATGASTHSNVHWAYWTDPALTARLTGAVEVFENGGVGELGCEDVKEATNSYWLC